VVEQGNLVLLVFAVTFVDASRCSESISVGHTKQI
jgi:hypothetical protein